VPTLQSKKKGGGEPITKHPRHPGMRTNIKGKKKEKCKFITS